MKNFYFVLLLLIFLSGCSSSLYEQINTNNFEPSPAEKPAIDSFIKERIIHISWEKDEGADNYILYRSSNPFVEYSEIYTGQGLSFEDDVHSYSTGKFFYYKLAKKRESAVFNKSDYAFGVVAEMSNDKWENNNSKVQTKCIDGNNLIYATLWLYRDEFGNTIVDSDYFTINVEPNMYILLKLNFENKPQGAIWDNYVYLYSSYSDNNGNTITESIDFKLYNTFKIRQSLYFQFELNKEVILGNPDEPGMKCISYSLSNMGLQPIVPQN